MNKENFKNHVRHCANTGNLVQLSGSLNKNEMGNIMADVAHELLNQGQDIKAIIILNERQRLGI